MSQPYLGPPYSGVATPARPPVGGFPAQGYYREMPAGVKDPTMLADLTSTLPQLLMERGCELLQMEERDRGPGDPWVLYDAWGTILAQWERRPSLGELLRFI